MSEQGMQVHHLRSVEGQIMLTLQKLSADKLGEALVKYQKAENTSIGTGIGVNDKGYFYSDDPDWDPDAPDAFKKPIGFIPWIQIHELLGNVPEGSAEGAFSTIN